MQADGWTWRSPWRWLWLAPWGMLLINTLSWLTLGSDLPFVDDWRAYADGTAGRWVPAHWFTAINNTMAPVGLALDALAQRVLAGNVIAYQFISQLLVQGTLLACQWRLLHWALPDRRLAVLAFTGTAFMLQAGSYWGEQNLAYHQALPLVWVMAALCVGLTSGWRPWVAGAAGLLLGGLAGLSYISGAVAGVVLGTGLLLVLLWAKPLQSLDAARAKAMAMGLWLAGVMSTGFQVWASRVLPTDVQGQAIPSAMPHEPAFWAYALGKLGRALGQRLEHDSLDVGLVVLVWAAVLVVLAVLAWLVLLRGKALSRAAEQGEAARRSLNGLKRVALVALPLAGMAAVYLMLIAHGRANFRDAGVQSWLQVYQFGYLRFHFYWLTLVLPWGLAAAAVCMVWRSSTSSLAARQPWGVSRSVLLGMGMLTLALLGLGAARSVFDLSSHYRSSTAFRTTQWACLQQQWGSGQPVHCPTFDMPDATGALLYAQHVGASFTRYLSLGPAAAGRELHTWQDDALRAGTWHDARWQPRGGWLLTGQDAQWLPDVPSLPHLVQAMAQCQALNVAVRLQASEAGSVQVFVQPQGETGFSEAHAARGTWAAAVGATLEEPAPKQHLHTVNLSLESAQGFAPALRVDVSEQPMWVRVHSVSVSCRLPTLAAWRAAQAAASPSQEMP